jgi:hypothetical protein
VSHSAARRVGSPPVSAPAGGGARAQSPRVPEFFVVGHAKSGTTALHEMLRRHPQIFLPQAKEPWYLARELHDRPPPRPEGLAASDGQYLALFAGAGAGQRIGEVSPLYLWSRTAAGAIARISPGARVIAILREPASFLRSLHLQFVESYVETEGDFARALALEGARRGGREIPPYTYWPQTLLYSEHVRYAEQLRRYHELLGRERVLVLIYEDFKRDNEATLRKVMRFLEVDDTVPVQSVTANPTVAVRSQRLHELVHAVSVGRGPVSLVLKRAIKRVTPTGARRSALRATQQNVLFTEPAAPDERLMNELRRRFAGEVRAVSEYLGRDLVSLWGYDELG